MKRVNDVGWKAFVKEKTKDIAAVMTGSLKSYFYFAQIRRCRYCIVVARAIPATAIINAPVFITIGTGTELYPLNKCNCAHLGVSGR